MLFGLPADEPAHVALAGIVLPNDVSVALHRKFGFAEIGTFHEYAVKNGEYLSSLWMQRLWSTPFDGSTSGSRAMLLRRLWSGSGGDRS
ncbi:hypothetical protein ABZS76_22135 [Streptomyces sp. NPDC005562]|uniref:GNAT family N-acetyltransferase n=1 Tax=unclassified Streptomyces TaxID=2593676 RepID=UPI0033B4CB66